MKSNMDKLVQVASKIRTPLALAGITVIVLYAIYRQVLLLDIFDNIGANSTFLLLQSILDRLFWLALISIFLGVLSYLIVFFLGRKPSSLSSNTDLLDSTLDPYDSPYEQKQNLRRNIIGPKQEILNGKIEIDEIHASQYHFPTIDFKFQNTGSATAFLWKFAIIILHCEIDVTPVLKFEASVRDELLIVTVNNTGWGAAQNCDIQVSEKALNKLLPSSTRTFLGTINGGETRTILELNRNQMDDAEFLLLCQEFVRLEEQYDRQMRSTYDSQEALFGIKLDTLRVRWTCTDENGRYLQNEQEVRHSFDVYFALTLAGFTKLYHAIERAHPCIVESDTTYIVMIDPSEREQELTYSISRKIPSGDVERFHIMLGAAKSCNLLVQFRFYIDKTKTIESTKFSVNIWNPQKPWIAGRYEDGKQLKRKIKELEGESRSDRLSSWDEQRKQRKLENLQKQASNYPFIEPLKE